MPMSVGIGPFRFYSGPGRRRRRIPTSSGDTPWALLAVSAAIGVGVRVVLVTLPWSAIAVGAVVLAAVFVHVARWMRRRSPVGVNGCSGSGGLTRNLDDLSRVADLFTSELKRTDHVCRDHDYDRCGT